MGRATIQEAEVALVIAGSKVATAIDALRGELGVSVPDLADRIERDRTHLWRVLHGKASLTADIATRCLRELANVVEYQTAASRG